MRPILGLIEKFLLCYVRMESDCALLLNFAQSGRKTVRTQRARRVQEILRRRHPNTSLCTITRRTLIDMIGEGTLLEAIGASIDGVWRVRVLDHTRVLEALEEAWGADDDTARMKEELREYQRGTRTGLAYRGLRTYSSRLSMGGVSGFNEKRYAARYGMREWEIDAVKRPPVST